MLFRSEGGRAPWTSGMAQAVAAQAFAAASVLLPDDAQLLPTAKAAFRTIPGRLVQTLSAGPWIKLYSFNNNVVLNAQLQTVISLQAYAGVAGDTTAASLASTMATAAVTKLPSFDTGFWSYYQLPSIVSPVDYQDYVVTLLKRLALKDKRFADAATRFASYDKQPPQFRLADASSTQVKFWVSKPATVTVSSLAAPKVLSVTGGWHTVSLPAPSSVGTYPVSLAARDWLGNTARADALPLVRVATPAGQSATAGGTPTTTAGIRKVAGTPGQSIRVMIGLDVMAQMPLALKEGIDSVRWSMIWQPGATGPDPNLVAQLLTLPAPYLLTLEIYATPVPTDDAGKAALASFAQAIVQQVPAIHDILHYVHANYAPPEIYVTENGLALSGERIESDGEIWDDLRAAYYVDHLEQVAKAIAEGVPVKGYFAWTLMDNFEWAYGYTTPFGLAHVDFASQARRLKFSGRLYGAIAAHASQS